MFTNPDIHPLGCRCACCHPYVPADRASRGGAQTHIVTAAGIAVVTAILVAALVLA